MPLTYSQAKAAIIDLRWLPDEARAALRDGGDWEKTDHTADMGNPFVSWDSDKRTYVLTHYIATLEVRGGDLYDVVLECDADGNWDSQDAARYGTPESAAMLADYSYEASRPGWKDYWVYVLTTGKDPINEVMYRRDVRQVARESLVRDHGVAEADLPAPHPDDCDCELCADLARDEAAEWYDELNRGYLQDRI